ncbi:hypothetical protein Btru_066225 [Bulinus truncatus]|nr:hypothetical protein Btru_066225 [Bulinus truncatus]
MDDYDPACPTEDDPPMMDIDLSQVPLPPSSPGPVAEKDREVKDGKKKKKKHERDREYPMDLETEGDQTKKITFIFVNTVNNSLLEIYPA